MPDDAPSAHRGGDIVTVEPRGPAAVVPAEPGAVLNVLITGGLGFVGTNLAARLAPERVRVRVFDSEVSGKRAHLGHFDGEVMIGDIRDRAALDAALDGIDAVVHLAADTRVMDSIANPAFNFDVNVRGTFNLLEAMRAQGIRRLINASTGGAIVGEVAAPVHEEIVPRPLAPYGASKLAAEGYCSAYCGSYGLQALSLRFSNVYGPRSFHKGSVVAAFFKRLLRDEDLTIYGDGSQVRDFVFVRDICEGIVQALRRPVTGVIQLGSGQPLSVNGLIEAMRAVVAPLPVRVVREAARVGEVSATWCDIARARRDLGFHPSTALHEGLGQTWAWFRDQAAGT